VVLKTIFIKNVKFKIIKIKTGCQYVGYFYYSKNLKPAAQNLSMGHMQPHRTWVGPSCSNDLNYRLKSLNCLASYGVAK